LWKIVENCDHNIDPWCKYASDEFDVEEVSGRSWGQRKKHFYGGNTNERPDARKASDKREDENELVRQFSTI
jgi:hypothetical protein